MVISNRGTCANDWSRLTAIVSSFCTPPLSRHISTEPRTDPVRECLNSLAKEVSFSSPKYAAWLAGSSLRFFQTFSKSVPAQ